MGMKNKDFEGKVALITGSSRGIGLATARELGARGAKIVLNARGKERLEAAKQELEGKGVEALAMPADVTSPEACEDMVRRAVEEFGRLDILMNNAGISMRAEFENCDAAACKKVVDINMLGCIYPTLYAVPEIKKNKGSIVFTSSIAGLIGLPTAALYCATKTGLRGFADALRCELAPDGVHVGVVYVGFTENDPEKRVLGAGSEDISPDRPAHMTQAQVAHEFAELIAKRKRNVALSHVGKFAKFISWFSPKIVEDTIIFSRRHKLNEKLNIR